MYKPFVIAAILLVMLGTIVSRIKYEVASIRKNLTNITNEISKGKEQLRILRAEWCNLTEPTRLKMLAKQYLPEMVPATSKNIISYDQLLHNSSPIVSKHNKKLSSLVEKKK